MVGISPRDNPNIGSTSGVVPDSMAKGPPPGTQIPKAMDKEGSIGKQFTGQSKSFECHLEAYPS